MYYTLLITKAEKNENYLAEMKQFAEDTRFGNRVGNYPNEPEKEIVKDVFTVQLTEEQFKAIKEATYKAWE